MLVGRGTCNLIAADAGGGWNPEASISSSSNYTRLPTGRGTLVFFPDPFTALPEPCGRWTRSGRHRGRCRCWRQYTTSESRLLTLYGPVHGLCSFLDLPCGTAGLCNHTKSPALKGHPCFCLLYSECMS